VQDETYDPARHRIGGLLSASIYWRDMLKGILPPGSDGIRVVFENPCNPPFTYQINGYEVEYLGTGDFHEPQYDYLAVSAPLLGLEDYAVSDSTYTGLPVEDEVCQFMIRVYPSTDMEMIYTTTNPLIYTSIVVAIFVFVSIMFVVYDCIIERRQRLVMESAVKTHTVVSSLYPSAVRDRLLNQEGSDRKSKAKRKNRAFKNVELDTAMKKGTTIADLYPETTVLFAGT